MKSTSWKICKQTSPKGTLDDSFCQAIPRNTAGCAWHLASGVEHLTPTNLLLIVVLLESSLELNEQFESSFNWQIYSLIISNHNMENGAVSPLSTIILSLFSSEVNVHLIQLIPSTWWLTIYSLSAHNLSSFRSPSPQTPPVLVAEESTSNVCAHLPNSAGPVSNTWDSTVHPKTVEISVTTQLCEMLQDPCPCHIWEERSRKLASQGSFKETLLFFESAPASTSKIQT